MPLLTDKTLNLLNKGILYIHGRTKDLSPILILDWGRLAEFLKNKEIDDHIFTSLHNYFANYIMYNMLVPGQVDRWITYTNINKFGLKDMPLQLFRAAAGTLAVNYIDNTSKAFVVNMTFIQNFAGRLILRFIDPDTVAKMFISYRADDPEVTDFISPS